MQTQSKDAVAILGIGRMATGLAVDMALLKQFQAEDDNE